MLRDRHPVSAGRIGQQAILICERIRFNKIYPRGRDAQPFHIFAFPGHLHAEAVYYFRVRIMIGRVVFIVSQVQLRPDAFGRFPEFPDMGRFQRMADNQYFHNNLLSSHKTVSKYCQNAA